MMLPEPDLGLYCRGTIPIDLPTGTRAMKEDVPWEPGTPPEGDRKPREREKYLVFFPVLTFQYSPQTPTGQLNPEGQGSLGNVVSCDTAQRERGRWWL